MRRGSAVRAAVMMAKQHHRIRVIEKAMLGARDVGNNPAETHDAVTSRHLEKARENNAKTDYISIRHDICSIHKMPAAGRRRMATHSSGKAARHPMLRWLVGVHYSALINGRSGALIEPFLDDKHVSAMMKNFAFPQMHLKNGHL